MATDPKPPIRKPDAETENQAKGDKTAGAAPPDLLDQLDELDAIAVKQGSSIAEIITVAAKALLGLDLTPPPPQPEL